MSSIATALTEHHRQCDALFERASDAARAGDWAQLRAQLAALSTGLGRHFAFEEEALFPAFEAATGMRDGPTVVMRMEHEHIRNLLDGLAAAAPEHDPDGFCAELDTLFVMLQQHNTKEEGIIYPACDQLPAAERDALAEEAAGLLAPGTGVLDLRALEPPEPFVRILQRLREAPATPLRVRIPREPVPLYEELQARGYRYLAQALADGSFEILIEPKT